MRMLWILERNEFVQKLTNTPDGEANLAKARPTHLLPCTRNLVLFVA